MSATVLFRQTPTMFTSSIGAVLDVHDTDWITEHDASPPGSPRVEVVTILGDDRDGWSHVVDSDDDVVGSVVITDDHHVSLYRRAFGLGASVTHLDATPQIVAQTIHARMEGDIIVPADVLGACLAPDSPRLSTAERRVLRNLVNEQTIAQVADSTHYSERHVRRIVRSILVKAGTGVRAEAIAHFRHEI